jgi:hypothetical protein
MTMVGHDTSFAKAIISTCKSWQRIGSEFLFRCLFFDEASKMRALCTLFDSEPALGRWTRRIHLDLLTRWSGMNDLDSAVLPLLIQHCPNLEILMITREIYHPFGSMVDTLSTYCSTSLQTVHWSLQIEELPKVIWALDSLPSLVSVHIGFHQSSWEDYHLGAANNIVLDLPNLRQLSLSGPVEEFMEQACGWNMPSLKSFSLDRGHVRIEQPDIVEFLTHHGSQLTFLDIYSIPAYDVARILDLCPLLQTFAFNADWLLPKSHDDDSEEDPDDIGGPLIHQPHQHITHIGLHGLLYAFDVGYAAAYASGDLMEAHIKIRENNDRNFDSLTRRRADFPKLKHVRALSPVLLRDLEEAGGPSGKYLERWDGWWYVCSKAGIRLEDCTGDLLGNLPQTLGNDEDDEEDDEDEDEDEGSSNENEERPREGSLADLRMLLQECRQMAETRDNPLFGMPLWP